MTPEPLTAAARGNGNTPVVPFRKYRLFCYFFQVFPSATRLIVGRAREIDLCSFNSRPGCRPKQLAHKPPKPDSKPRGLLKPSVFWPRRQPRNNSRSFEWLNSLSMDFF